ncbi:MAG: tRNA pseudouridine(55) synthase TruB [Candidatus Magasanikbacteria bacterium]
MLDTQNNNFLLIDKPVGWTSFDAVNFLRARLRVETGNKKIKVGHAGTLDPFATGLLIVAVGRENTKRIDGFQKLPKTYVATIHLGATSDTQDSTGVIIQTEGFLDFTRNDNEPTQENIELTLKTFIGKQLQTPPMYSAKKVDGQRLYKLARQGKEIEREPVEIEIYDIKLLNYNWPLLEIEVQCSTGTYIRTLAEDIGTKLGCGAYCEQLRRTKIGEYSVENATKIEK